MDSTVTVLSVDDQDAIDIGALVRKGTEHWIEAGRMLAAKKKQLGHGNFGTWIENNRPALGFDTPRTAQMLMAAAAKAKLTSHVGASDIWGNKSTTEKAERRATRERELAAKQTALPSKKYGVILADPEWRFEPWSRETGMDRAADNHYPTSYLEVIKARPVADIAADDCVLFLWATVPMLPQALFVMQHWGFVYRSHCIWAKDRVGTGYWFRNAHELLLVGARGDVPAPAPGTQFPSVIEGRVTKHSAKPECFLEMIEALFPSLPKIELNRRGPSRPGWGSWGNESESTAALPDTAVVPQEPAPLTSHAGAGSTSFDPDDLAIPDYLRRT